MDNYESLFPELEKAQEEQPLRKNYRTTSPVSSVRAVEEHAKSGAMGSARRRALTQVQARSGLTSKEYAGGDFPWLIELRKRLSDLERDGLVFSTQNGTEDKRWYYKGNQ